MLVHHSNAMHAIIPKGIVMGLVTLAGLTLDEKTGVPIGIACAVGMAWASGVWWLGRKLQKVDDELEQAKTDRAAVYAALSEDRQDFKETVREIFTRLNNLPCNSCPDTDKRKHK